MGIWKKPKDSERKKRREQYRLDPTYRRAELGRTKAYRDARTKTQKEIDRLSKLIFNRRQAIEASLKRIGRWELDLMRFLNLREQARLKRAGDRVGKPAWVSTTGTDAVE